MPHANIDPVVAASAVLSALQVGRAKGALCLKQHVRSSKHRRARLSCATLCPLHQHARASTPDAHFARDVPACVWCHLCDHGQGG